MELVWKLLRQHISIPQFAGFAFANLFGMLIVLFGFQFYKDVLPVFTQQDSFMKADYLIMSKKIGMGNTLSGRTNTFSGSDVDDISSQKFVKKIGKFTSTEYKVDASMGVNGVNVLNSELFSKVCPTVLSMCLSRIGSMSQVVRKCPSSFRVPILICTTLVLHRVIRFQRSATD